MRRERGLILVIAYKVVKGALALLAAAALVVAVNAGFGDRVAEVAEYLRHHARAWSVALADLVVKVSTRRGLYTAAVALAADGAFTLFEGWALWRGRWWAPWLVVVATSCLLPFEIAAVVRKPHLVRAAVFAVNVAIVAYLVRRARGTRTGADPS